jgi:formylmethanofuran dehydrogenase subunit E
VAATTYLVYTDLVPQVDLIAMKHGYKIDVLNQDDEWVQIGLTREDQERIAHSINCEQCHHPMNEHFGSGYGGCVLCPEGFCHD